MARRRKDEVESKEVEVKEEVKVATEPEPKPEPKPARKIRKEIDRNEMISCRNVTSGSLVYVSRKTGLTTMWEKYGDEEFIDFGELLTMKSSQPRFLNEPWLVIDDEDVAEYLGLKNLYESLVPVDELEGFFKKSPQEIQEKLRTLPSGSRQLIGEKARKMIATNELYDMRIIKILEQELNIDLILFQE